MTTANATNLSGYRLLEVLYQSSRTQVYRAIREADQHSVIVKILSNPHPSFNELLQFRNQYTIGQHLNHPGIGSITELLPWKNGQALIMADSGEISLADYLAASPTGLPLAEVLEIGRQMADILHYLSQQRVIHKDIKPANTLIHPESKQIKLIDFSISSLLPRETQTLQNLSTLEGTLAYIAPEQTGRMNRSIDYRADFYTLGVTLYQLLTGKLPFESEDPLELVHDHLAKNPPSIQSWCPDVPRAVSAIVAKLMAKTAEERYQSAAGLKADLEACLHQWQTTRTVKHFALGQLDEITQFNMPQRLYGREQPVQQLLAAFDRVCQGGFELVVVKGYSGVGKTALVQELLGRLTEYRGYFAAGKFDQLQRDAPLAVPVQTLRQSVQQLLTESQSRLDYWRDRILSDLGENVRLIVDAIPELEHIVGSQPEVPPLEGAAAAMRFGETFNRFAQCLSGPDHPYVCFIDDWQWADSASFEVFPRFIIDPRNSCYLSVLAYRDNEVGPTHPLVPMLETIRQAGVRITEIHLKPLGCVDVAQFVADTLHRKPTEVAPLADVLFQKTEGNPFFLTQLLMSLHSDRLVWFETESKQWQWDLDAIQRANLTDNVVDLVIGRLSQLSEGTRQLLSLAACIGNQFDLHTLAIIAEQTPAQAAQGLLPALQFGFVVPLSEAYKDFLSADLLETSSNLNARNCGYQFAHDRVQQAAYVLIPAEQVEQTHYRIAQLLLQESDITPTGKALMELVGHINAAQSCLNTVAEREAAARINLLAGQQAQASAAFAAAYDFYQTGLTLLRDTSWQTTYDLTRDLHQAAAKAACLAANHAETERLVEISLTYSRSKLDRAAAYQLQVQSLKFQSNYRQAIAVGLQALAELGIDLPEQLTPDHLAVLGQQTARAWGDRDIEDLIDLPMMADPTAIMTIELLRELLAAAYLGNPALFPLIAEQQLYLVLTDGLCPAAALTCMAKAVGICVFQQDWPTGIRFAQTAMAILNKLNVKQDQGIVTYSANTFVLIFSRHLKGLAQSAQNNITVCLELGDFENGTHSAFNYACYASCLETPLPVLEQRIADYYAELAPLKHSHPLTLIQLQWQAIRRLLNLPATPKAIPDIAYVEDPTDPKFEAQHLFNGELQELMLSYCLGDTAAALQHAEAARPYAQSHAGQLNAILFSLYDALANLANYVEGDTTEQQQTLERVEHHYQYLNQCAQQAPMNYQHKLDLLVAERHRVLGERYQAMDAYDRAIAGATEQGFLSEAAMANERAAEFYFDLDKPKVA
ncbi:MAG: serine/threonine-protein kinase PknK, partial [Cyanobacteria bacterium P01_D01_bin.128]